MKRAVFLSFLLTSSLAFAQEAFLPGTEDVPLMEGLTVNPTANLDFDTPAGQIRTVNATGKSLTGQKITAYYRQTLPALGWRFEKGNRFVREKDSLVITVLKETKPAVVRFETTMTNLSE